MTDDPKTTDQIFEQQQVTCLAYGGSFQLRFRRKASNIIPFLSSLEELKDILESTPSVGLVDIEMSAATVCSPLETVVTNITFKTDHGNVPEFRVDTLALNGTVTVQTLQDGSKEAVECSNRGHCDFATGRCDCAPQYGSSDGNGNVGRLGDCGVKNVLYELGQDGFPRKLRTNNSNTAG